MTPPDTGLLRAVRLRFASVGAKRVPLGHRKTLYLIGAVCTLRLSPDGFPLYDLVTHLDFFADILLTGQEFQ